jgi:uncharacterized cupredoxin-like copper-binding protein
MTFLNRKLAFALLGLLAATSLASVACGGGGTEAGAQAPETTQAVIAAHQATAAPVVAATVAATPLPATPAPATPEPVVATQAPAATAAPPAAPAQVDVTVTLSEFKVESSLTTFHAGVPYHFTITNNGKIQHEINLAFVNTATVPVGGTKTLDLTFTDQGSQEFACHLGGHYEAGMKLPITVGP